MRRRAAAPVALVALVALVLATRAGAVEPPPDAPQRDPPPQVTRLSLPFTGMWGVVQGFDSGDTHVGYATYALDFVPVQRAGARPPRRGAPLRKFACFGRPVLAPADGRVVRAGRGARDFPAYVKGRGEGNFVILEHAPGEYTELRHLAAGSVRATVGETVRRGDVIGRCGNSGNATTPHLHIGFLWSADPITTRPMVFSGYEVLGPGGVWRPGDGALREGDIVRASPADPPVAPRKARP